MSEKKDFYAQAKSQMRLSERILAAIPGFRGYKEKELRRESDKLIRNHLYLQLSAAKNDLRVVFQKLSDRRWFDVLTDMDRLMAKVDRVVQKVNHASYGYSGFFDIVKVTEANLDRMIDFDSQLVDDVNSLASAASVIKADAIKGALENAKDRIQALNEQIDTFESAFDKRTEVILGVS